MVTIHQMISSLAPNCCDIPTFALGTLLVLLTLANVFCLTIGFFLSPFESAAVRPPKIDPVAGGHLAMIALTLCAGLAGILGFSQGNIPIWPFVCLALPLPFMFVFGWAVWKTERAAGRHQPTR